MSKTHTMWAIPFNRANLKGTLNMEASGAWALFSTEEMARACAVGSPGPREPVKVRVTIELSGKRVAHDGKTAKAKIRRRVGHGATRAQVRVRSRRRAEECQAKAE